MSAHVTREVNQLRSFARLARVGQITARERDVALGVATSKFLDQQSPPAERQAAKELLAALGEPEPEPLRADEIDRLRDCMLDDGAEWSHRAAALRGLWRAGRSDIVRTIGAAIIRVQPREAELLLCREAFSDGWEIAPPDRTEIIRRLRNITRNSAIPGRIRRVAEDVLETAGEAVSK